METPRGLTKDGAAARVAALTRLAVATREKVEPSVYVVYVDDTQDIREDVFLEACRRLEKSSTWFPKVAELIEECRKVSIVFAERHAAAQIDHSRKLVPFPHMASNPERWAQFKADVEAEIQRKRMR